MLCHGAIDVADADAVVDAAAAPAAAAAVVVAVVDDDRRALAAAMVAVAAVVVVAELLAAGVGFDPHFHSHLAGGGVVVVVAEPDPEIPDSCWCSRWRYWILATV